ncbi:sterol desaturase family protein [Sneathiella sp. P13V-1]|uniref:sterol desaturase family protein n=1 Tax=Sneathiella sp. P13V-1 TaxID=2697366 RepID=UPI00187BBDEA|nr:sterol desaturase family protein [Sneathiella sp. P13V-1]MBE7636461.1 sterol desaturase family protein [Sneathiella sp. P13V-1]
MFDQIMENEPTIRLVFFFGTLALVALWEILSPRRELRVTKWWRWANNLGLTFLNSFILRIAFPILAVGMAALAAENGWGLLNIINLPLWASVIIAVIVQDLIIYGQHVIFHHVPILWRLHKMHHADPDYDVTTGARFHPIEICLSMGIKLGVVFLLGPPVIAVIIFEILLSSMAMFNHANATLPGPIDKIVRLFVVTPDMHRVHHSAYYPEFNHNFGFNLSIWDRIFGTYKKAPDDGQLGMTIGLEKYQKDLKQSILWMILLPFKR